MVAVRSDSPQWNGQQRSLVSSPDLASYPTPSRTANCILHAQESLVAPDEPWPRMYCSLSTERKCNERSPILRPNVLWNACRLRHRTRSVSDYCSCEVRMDVVQAARRCSASVQRQPAGYLRPSASTSIYQRQPQRVVTCGIFAQIGDGCKDHCYIGLRFIIHVKS